MTYKIETPKTHMHQKEVNRFDSNTKKLSEFENDLFYTHRTPVITITKDDFVGIEMDGDIYSAYVHDGLWPGEFTPDKIGYECFINAYYHYTEVDLPFEIFDDVMIGNDLCSITNGGDPEYQDKMVLFFNGLLDGLPDTFKIVLYQIDTKQIPSEVLPCTDIVEMEFDEESQWFVDSTRLRKLKLLTEDTVLNARESDVFVSPDMMVVDFDGNLYMQTTPTFTHYIPDVFNVSTLVVGGTVTHELPRNMFEAYFHNYMTYMVPIKESDNVVYTLIDTPVYQGRNAVATHNGKVFKSHRIEDVNAITIVITRVK